MTIIRYPVFGGVIYETNMIGLTQGKQKYKYRVGGYDSVNATTRRSQDFEFYSAPLPAPEQKTVFGMLGDQVSLTRAIFIELILAYIKKKYIFKFLAFDL